MNYYTRHLGDYYKKTGRLSTLEHGAYTLLLDAYYDRERPPTKSEAIEWSWARNKEEIAAVEFVLDRFFVLDGEVYRNKRADEEIANFRAKALKNKQIAEDREAAKRQERERVVNESCKNVNLTNNQEPITNNQEPRTKNQEPITNNQKKEKEGARATGEKKTVKFFPPSLEEVSSYCAERKNSVNPQSWIDHYLSNGWMVGKSRMKDWRACVRKWEHNGYGNGKINGGGNEQSTAERDAEFRRICDGVQATGNDIQLHYAATNDGGVQ